VAFDVYQKMGASYFGRCIRHLTATTIFILVAMYIHLNYMLDAGVLFSLQAHIEFQHFLWVNPGFLRKLLPLWLEYFHPQFHPWTFRKSKIAIPLWNQRIQDRSLTSLDAEDADIKLHD
jgi:predicted metal-dependent hydrolase